MNRKEDVILLHIPILRLEIRRLMVFYNFDDSGRKFNKILLMVVNLVMISKIIILQTIILIKIIILKIILCIKKCVCEGF